MTTKKFIKTSTVSILAAVFLLAAVPAFGVTYEITGNGSGNNSVQVQQSTDNVINQQNTANVNNNVNTTAETGGNSINGDAGNPNITTGNATVQTTICNSLNTNVVGGGGTISTPCTSAPSKTPSNNSTPPGNPQMGGGAGGGSSSGSSNNSGSNSSSSDPVVAGLAGTSSANDINSLLRLIPATGSLLFGSFLLRRKHA